MGYCRLGEGVCENRVADGHDGGNGEEGADAESGPDPAAYRACEEGDEVVDGDAGGHGGGQLIVGVHLHP